MGTQKTDWLYHLEMPNKSTWEYALSAIHYVKIQTATFSAQTP